MVSEQYRAWSDCTEMQAGLALYWWQRLITVSSYNYVSLYNVSTGKTWKLIIESRSGLENQEMD